MEEETSVLIGKEPCPSCGSDDNLARYSDGHAFCFGAGCGHLEPATEGENSRPAERKPSMSKDIISGGKYRALKSRRISESTCRKFDYKIGKTKSGLAHIAAYRDQEGNITAQHLRLEDKEFPWVGKKKNLQLFGQHTARDGATKVIITEGEIDAMSVAEVLDSKRNRFAVVSIASGASGAKKDIATNLPWLEKAEEVILMFDNDEPGQIATAECVRLFRPGKVKIAKLPLKDASDMLQNGRGHEIIDAIFEAKAWRPEGVVRLEDVMDKVMTDPSVGLPWFHPGLDKAVLGRRLGELDALGAGTGVGKTDLLTQQIEFDIYSLGEKVGLFFLEQQPAETVRRIVGKHAGKKFHIPANEENPWEREELEAAVKALDATDALYMYDHFGSADYDLIEQTVRHLYHSEGVKLFYIDHLTALAAAADDERKALEQIMAALGGLVKELDIWVCIISHLATPEGKPHEEGGRVMIRHFKGSRAIGFWCHHMYGIERNQQAEFDDDDYGITKFRVLKDRVTGQATGKVFELGYDHETGRLTDADDMTSAFSGDTEAMMKHDADSKAAF